MSLIISNRDALVAHAAGCLAARQAQAPAPRLRLGNISGLDFSGLNLEGLTLLAPFLAGGYNISLAASSAAATCGARG